MAKKTSKHPRLYTIFSPNELIKAKKFNMSFIEKRVYYEILNHNHVKTPDTIVYSIPYEKVLNPNDLITGNRRTNAKRIREGLMTRSFAFDSSFMKKHFGQDSDSYMIPFPQIDCYDDHFDVHLHKPFKTILTMVGLGFTKGDIDALRGFKYEISDEFYWLIRQRQAWASSWEVELEELKERLGLEGSYTLYQNFRTKVLEKAKEDHKDEYTEFDYKPIKKGRGGAVTAIVFYFKNGPKEEKDAPAGDDFIWEEKLLQLGVLPDKIKEIRQRVKVGQVADDGLIWDSEYVRFSLEAFHIQLKDKKKNDKKTPIKNNGAYFYAGLISGFWKEYVNARKEKIKIETQSSFEFKEPETPKQLTTQTTALLAQAAKQRVTLTDKEILDWKALYDEVSASPKFNGQTFEEFMAISHIEKEGDNWVKNIG